MKRNIRICMAVLMLLALTACSDTTLPNDSEEPTDTSVADTATTDEVTVSLTESGTETKVETIPVTEAETELEPETEPETEPDVEGALPEGEADLTYECGDGMVLSQYNGQDALDFYAASQYYRDEGYTLYSKRREGGVLSATYTKDDSYYTLLFNAPKGELGIGYKETGASILPTYGLSYEDKNETTVTQINTLEINGMGYIIRLSDGTFIVIDGGHEGSYTNFMAAFQYLHGSMEHIHIRAWILSHAHGDHTDLFWKHSVKLGELVRVDHFLYAPVANSVAENEFITRVPTLVTHFPGANLVSMHSGMTFQFADVRVEVLYTYEQVYKNGKPDDFNESSTVFRLTNGEGSMIFLGDIGIAGCNWLMETYGEELKSDMVQVSHHGVETAPFSIYEHIRAATVFWPCDESLMANTRGENRQPLVCADFAKEHILHGYGQATRPLSYKATGHEYLDILPKDPAAFKTSDNVGRVYEKNGAICYDLTKDGNAYVDFSLEGISTEKYNAVRLVVGADDCNGAAQFSFKCGGISRYRNKTLLPQGNSIDGKTNTLILYLGNEAKYTDDLTDLRIQLGALAGQTVEIYSIELFWLDMDD